MQTLLPEQRSRHRCPRIFGGEHSLDRVEDYHRWTALAGDFVSGVRLTAQSQECPDLHSPPP
jgi:hypothetical protein